MKRCPECRRDYYDETLLYCLDDGSALLEGPGSADTQATAVFAASHPTSEEQTRTFDNSPTRVASKRKNLIAGVLGIVLVAAIGVGSYLYYGRTGTEINSIAVLPFINESGNPEIEYLSDGMTDTLINNLSRIPKLSVKARSSVFKFKGKDAEPQKVAADLNVQAIVNGRVMQRGDSLTLNLELVDARSGDQIWGEQYVRKIGDLVALQSDIARDVSNKLREKLSGTDTERISKRGTESAEAYQQYLKGRFHWNKRTMGDINKSIEYFQKAIELDPSYAVAYAGLADSYVVIPSYSNNRSKEVYPKARSAAIKALEIDDSLAEAHTTLACVLYEFDWKFDESEREFKRAIELDPNYATAHHWYSEYLALVQGRHDEAHAEIKRAQECDPLSLIINSIVGVSHAARGEFAEAEAQLKKTIELDPNFARAHIFLAEIYERQGKFEEAIGTYERHAAIKGLQPEEIAKQWGAVRQAYRKDGASGYWRQLLALVKSIESDPEKAPPMFVIAYLYIRVGDHDRAFEYLERSFDRREPDIVRLKNPGLDPIRSDPRYVDLARRIGVPQ